MFCYIRSYKQKQHIYTYTKCVCILYYIYVTCIIIQSTFHVAKKWTLSLFEAATAWHPVLNRFDTILAVRKSFGLKRRSREEM